MKVFDDNFSISICLDEMQKCSKLLCKETRNLLMFKKCSLIYKASGWLLPPISYNILRGYCLLMSTLAIELAKMVVCMFVDKLPNLFFCHFSEEPVYKTGIGKICIFLDQRNPFLFFNIKLTAHFFLVH